MTLLTHRTGHTSWEDAQQRCLDNGDARLATIANSAQQVKDYLLLCFVPLSDESLLLFIREMTPTNNANIQDAVVSILNFDRNAYIGLNDRVNEVVSRCATIYCD